MIKNVVSSAALSLILLTVSLNATPVWAEKFYKWVDEEGVTHYSVRAPADAEAEALKIKTSKPAENEKTGSETTSAEDITENEEENTDEKAALSPEELAEIKKQDKENCDRARKNLYILNNRARVVTIDEKTNEHHYLSEEERAAQKTESEQAVKDFCD